MQRDTGAGTAWLAGEVVVRQAKPGPMGDRSYGDVGRDRGTMGVEAHKGRE